MGSAKSLLGGDSPEGTVEAWLILEYCDLGTLMVSCTTICEFWMLCRTFQRCFIGNVQSS